MFKVLYLRVFIFFLISYYCCNISLHRRCGQGHLLIFFSLCLWNDCAKFNQFSLNKQHKTDGVLSSSQQIMLGKIDVLSLSFALTHTPLSSLSDRVCVFVCLCVFMWSAAGTLNWQSCENATTPVHSLPLIITLLRHQN